MAAPCGLSLSAAVGCCLALSVGYVGSLYAVPRRIARLHRDVPEHIHARCLAVAVASAVSVGVFAFVSRGGACYGGLFSALGFGGAWASAAAVCRVLALTAALYTGPFAAEGLGILCELDGAGRRGSVAGFLEIVLERSRDLYTREPTLALRNYVIGPATEEVVFRSCMVPLLLEADLGLGRTIFCSPLFFGVAHLHHLKRRLVDERANAGRALLETAVQFAYTTLFGAYTTFVFVRTGHVAAAVACHVFCNVMGLPDLAFVNEPRARESYSQAHHAVRLRVHARRRALLGLYVGGIFAFALLLFPLTDFEATSAFWRRGAREI